MLATIFAVALGMTGARDAAATGSITGRVTGPDGKALAGVEVQAHVANFIPQLPDMFSKFPPGTGGLVGWTVTQPDGTYELDNLEPTPQPWCEQSFGHYVLLFSPPRHTGFLPKIYRGHRGPPSPVWEYVTVEDDKTLTGIDVRLGPPASLAGTVTGPDGAPLSGVTVSVAVWNVYSDMPGTFLTRTTTDGRGRYVLTGVEYDDLWLRVSIPGGAQPLVFFPGTAGAVRVRPIRGGINNGFDIAVQAPGSILINGTAGGGWAESFASAPGSLYDVAHRPLGHRVNALPPGTYRVAKGTSAPNTDT